MRVLLLDAYNLLFRSFVTLPESITSGGKPINAVYGTIAAILRLWRETEATSLIAAFDSPDSPTFRHRIFPAYQGQRGPLGGDRTDDFAHQVEVAREILPGIGVPALRQAGYEADDILGTLACRFQVSGFESVMVSTDRDLLQLVRPDISLLSPSSPPVYARSADDVRRRLGVAPAGVTTFKALAGDASDNIPGVRGIGTKTAAGLVNQYGSLEAIYAHLDALPPRAARALAAGRDDAILYREVATIITDLDLPIDPGKPPTPNVPLDSRVGDILTAAGYRRP